MHGPRAVTRVQAVGETLGVTTPGSRAFRHHRSALQQLRSWTKITDRRVIPAFARDLFAGRDLVLLSDGSPTRTFCYVADAIVGYYKILVRGRPGESYNIGNETPEISMRELAELLAGIARDEIGYTGKVICGASHETDYLTDNPTRRCPVIAKAQAHLDFYPEISLQDGLRRTLLWYRDHQEEQEAA